MDDFDKNKLYVVEGTLIQSVKTLMERLYSEKRMGGDEMRDWGNALFAQLDRDVWPYKQ